jgi:hypothetical protein
MFLHNADVYSATPTAVKMTSDIGTTRFLGLVMLIMLTGLVFLCYLNS